VKEPLAVMTTNIARIMKKHNLLTILVLPPIRQ